MSDLEENNPFFKLGQQIFRGNEERQAMQAVIQQMASALRDIKVCITYTAQPKEFNGVLGYEARVPVEFVTILDNALTAAEPYLNKVVKDE